MQAREKVEKSRFAVFSNDLRLRRGEKLQAVVARSAFQSKFTNHTTIGSLLEVGMSKKRTPLWRETNFEVKMGKPPQNRTTFRN